jgi:hypothetical protein
MSEFRKMLVKNCEQVYNSYDTLKFIETIYFDKRFS